MQGTDEEYATAESTAELLQCEPHAAAKGGSHPQDLIVNLAKQVLAHGEHEGF
jgi:hypothetical protein